MCECPASTRSDHSCCLHCVGFHPGPCFTFQHQDAARHPEYTHPARLETHRQPRTPEGYHGAGKTWHQPDPCRGAAPGHPVTPSSSNPDPTSLSLPLQGPQPRWGVPPTAATTGPARHPAAWRRPSPRSPLGVLLLDPGCQGKCCCEAAGRPHSHYTTSIREQCTQQSHHIHVQVQGAGRSKGAGPLAPASSVRTPGQSTAEHLGHPGCWALQGLVAGRSTARTRAVHTRLATQDPDSRACPDPGRVVFPLAAAGTVPPRCVHT